MNLTFIHTLLIVLMVNLSADAQRREPLDITIDFESYDPPSTLVVPENPVSRAKYPFIDIHNHQWRMGEGDLSKLVSEMDTLNMQVLVNLSGRGGAALKAMTDNVKSQDFEDRLVVFTNINIQSIDEPDWSEETVKQLEFDVANGAKGLKIFKSQGMRNKDKSGNRIPINDPRIDPVWAKCGELGIPILIHSADPRSFWLPHDSLNERWLELKLRPGRKRGPDNPATWEQIISEQHDIFRKHPNTTFINAHFGWFANDLAKLSELLDELPNMYVEFGAVIAELGRQPRNAARFFEQYQDRILFGKDAYHPQEYFTYFRVLETADEHFPYYKRYHAFWKMYGLDLPDEILRKIYYKNGAKLLGLDLNHFE
ncbi:MAG: amidohydrolase family protein [Saprospiraceae bacterium]|nr:amidohydrolase family protein [Saprospiraceae bacterium]